MARIRTIKPEFPQSESMGRVSRDARLLFLLLFTFVDDSGKARASSRVLASFLYPFDDDAQQLLEVWLSELERERAVFLYEIEGNRYLQIVKWLDHQKIDRPSASRLPDPIANPREGSRVLDAVSRTVDLVPRIMEQGPRASVGESPREPKKRAAKKTMIPPPDDWMPNARHETLALELGVNLGNSATEMLDWAKSKGEKCLDWDARFSNWIRRDAKMRGNGHNGARGAPSRSERIIAAGAAAVRQINEAEERRRKAHESTRT